MKYEFDPNLPIYIQVMEEIKKAIFTKQYLPGVKIASVRELAVTYSVNPNTVQKALSELERTGIIYSKRAQGRYVSEDEKLIEKLKKEVCSRKVKDFVVEMEELGFDTKLIIEMIEELA